MKTFEFIIRVVGDGENEAEAWADAKQSAAQKVDEDTYTSALLIGED